MDEEFEALFAELKSVKTTNEQAVGPQDTLRGFEEGYGHIFSWIPTKEEYLRRTTSPKSQGRLYIRNPQIKYVEWSKLVDPVNGLLAQLNDNSNSPIFDFRLETMDGLCGAASASEEEAILSARYGYAGEVITASSGFGKFSRPETIQVEEEPTVAPLLILGSTLSQHCPKLEILSLFGLSFMPADASIVRSNTLRSLNLSDLRFTSFPKIDKLLPYIMLLAPNIEEIYFGDLSGMDAGRLLGLLNLEQKGQLVNLAPITCVGKRIFDPVDRVEAFGRPFHVLENVKKIHFTNCNHLTEQQLEGLTWLPKLEEIGFRGCRQIEQSTCLESFKGTTIVIGDLWANGDSNMAKFELLDRISMTLQSERKASRLTGTNQQPNNSVSVKGKFPNLVSIDISCTLMKNNGSEKDALVNSCVVRLRRCGVRLVGIKWK